MKTKTIIGIIAFVALIAFVMVSCSSDNDEDLIGKWYFDQAKTDEMFDFRTDGKVLIEGVDDGTTYTTKDGIITFTYPDGETETIKYSISGNVMTLSGASGDGDMEELNGSKLYK